MHTSRKDLYTRCIQVKQTSSERVVFNYDNEKMAIFNRLEQGNHKWCKPNESGFVLYLHSSNSLGGTFFDFLNIGPPYCRVYSPRMQRIHCNQVFVNSEVNITVNKLTFGYLDSLQCIDKDKYYIFILKYCRTAFIHHLL